MRVNRCGKEKIKKNRICVIHNIEIILLVISIAYFCVPSSALAAEPPYDQVVSAETQISPEEVTKYGMLPIYGRDVEDGTYSIEVVSSSSMFRVVSAQLTVEGDKMEAAITLSGHGYSKLYMGTGTEAAASDMSDFIGYTEGDDGEYTYIVPVDGLNKALPCAAFSQRKEQWYDRMILFDASSLPEDALLVDLPDYDAIESAMGGNGNGGTFIAVTDLNGSESNREGEVQTQNIEAMELDMEDGEYSIEVAIAGGSGKATVSSPTILIVKDGHAYARLIWSSSNYDYMIVGTEKYYNLNDGEGNSTFEIPIGVMDEEMTVIGDTTAMGTPHEVEYTLTFYGETIGDKSKMPQEAAKRVVIIGIAIIIGGGILNHYVQKKRRA